MSSKGSFPTAYVGDVGENRSLLEYVPFQTMDIGARKSGLPKENMMGPKSLDHVGTSAGGKK